MEKHHNNPDKCVTCTACVVHCPVTEADRKFCGPKMLGPGMERFRLFDGDDEPSLEYCSNCKNCDISCPSGVPISTLNMLAKAKYYKKNKHRLRDWVLSHGELMGKLGSVTPFLTNMGMSNPLSKLMMQQIGIAPKAPLPPYAAQTFQKQFAALRQKSSENKVVFFPGCFINYNDPAVGMDFVAVMQAAGYEVLVPENLVCCGSPLVASGYLDEAEQNARTNTAELAKWTAQGYPVIMCCTSCSLMLKQEYQELFSIEGVAENAAKMYDASEFILELMESQRLKLDLQPIAGQYIYHAPCHLRAQGIGLPSWELLQMIPNLAIEQADAGCCGISGNYGFKDDRYDVAMKVGAPLFQRIKSSGADTAVSDCGTCRLQLAHGGGVKTAHPLSLLRRSLSQGK